MFYYEIDKDSRIIGKFERLPTTKNRVLKSEIEYSLAYYDYIVGGEVDSTITFVTPIPLPIPILIQKLNNTQSIIDIQTSQINDLNNTILSLMDVIAGGAK